MGLKLLAQVILIAASLLIIFGFIQPSFREIKGVQDELFQYKDAVLKAEQFNARLRELITIRDSVSSDDMATLERFIPSQIDAVQVMREIEAIFEAEEVPIVSLTAKEEIAPISNVIFEQSGVELKQQSSTNYRDFEVAFNGSYEQMKNILLLVEANSLLLEVINFQFETIPDAAVPEEGGNESSQNNDNHDFIMTLRAFSLASSQ